MYNNVISKYIWQNFTVMQVSIDQYDYELIIVNLDSLILEFNIFKSPKIRSIEKLAQLKHII